MLYHCRIRIRSQREVRSVAGFGAERVRYVEIQETSTCTGSRGVRRRTDVHGCFGFVIAHPPPLFNTNVAFAQTPGNRDSSQDFDTLLAAGNEAPGGLWTDGTTMWVGDSGDSKIYAYKMSDKSRDAAKDFDTLTAAGNALPLGIWSNGTTMWVSDFEDTNLYAYNLSTKAREQSNEITLDSANTKPRGIWGNGTTIWVADSDDNTLYAYTIATGARDTGKDITLHTDNGFATGIWSNGTTMWVADIDDDKIYAYTLTTGARDSSKDYDSLSGAGNNNPNGIWSDGTTMWVTDAVDDKIYAYDSIVPPPDTRDSAKDFDTLSAAGNNNPRGIWSDGTTMWVADVSGKKIYAYNLSTKARDSAKDFDTLDAAGNDFPFGIWSDGTTMWVSDIVSRTKLFAYKMSDKSRDSGKDISLHADNGNARGLWGNSTTIWVGDTNDVKLYAYKMSDKSRDSGKDIGLHSDNGTVDDIWSDGTTMWVSDSGDDKLYAYTISTKARDSSKEYDSLSGAGNNAPYGIWSNGTTMWVADRDDNKLYAYHSFPPPPPTPTTPPTPTPTNTPTITPTVETIDRRYMASRIEPSVSGLTVSSGDAIRLAVNIFGGQNVQDQGLAEHHEYVWQEDGSAISGAQSPEIAYTAPSSPGTYKVVASLGPRYCSGDTAACSAEFVIRVRRSAVPQPAMPVPANPDGKIPTILTDGDGNQYEVFTPAEGGTFDAGEGYSIVAPSSAVQSGEYIGVRMYESGSASNAGMTHQRYTLGGSQYDIAVVDSEGETITSYRLNAAAKVCVPLPGELSENISEVAILATNADGTLTVLSSSVRIGASGTEVCGSISELPATVAVGKQGAPAAIPAPTPEPTPEAPETGGKAPSAGVMVWLVLMGVAIVGVSLFAVKKRV